MRGRTAWVVLSLCFLTSCTGKGEVVRAAQPHIETFSELRARALELLELRAGVERNKRLYAATQGDEDAASENLEPLLEQMEAENVQITQEELDRGDASFWRMLDLAFSSPEVLQAEIVLVEKDGAISRFRTPRKREVPAGVRWYGLRQQRTFAGLANCVTEDGSEPCVLIQLRPRDYSGSAGLTVGFRRDP
jgi:hypothetical protein